MGEYVGIMASGAALCDAASRGDADAVGEILDRCPGAVHARDAASGFTPLARAAAVDAEACVALLLAREPPLSARAPNGDTALHVAAAHGSARCAALLAADFRFRATATNDWQETPLHGAAAAGDARTIQVLVAAGADVAARDRWRRVPLRVAPRVKNKMFMIRSTWSMAN